MFVERVTAPEASNPWYYENNRYYKNGFGMPNCTAYAEGRYNEIHGKQMYLPYGNAEDWYPNAKSFKYGNTPKVGAVICWRKGKSGTSSDGAGHVAVVERINDDGSILTSNSNYKGTNFYLKTFSPSNNYYLGSAYTFQGFIYPQTEISSGVGTPVDRDTTKDQIEITTSVLNGRIYPGKKSRIYGYVNPGIYNIIKVDGYDVPYMMDDLPWYCIDNDINGIGDRLWVAFSEDWAKLLPAGDTPKPTYEELERQIALMKNSFQVIGNEADHWRTK